mmetsp:Transcript_4759/g.13861  ORF Transcript_4759/g.13861 Transcript_4759/m.13861 type:complete len:205 (-) Transcript_4759:1067-1681(-)
MTTRPTTHVYNTQYTHGNGFQPPNNVKTHALGWSVKHLSLKTSYLSVSNKIAGEHHDPLLNQSPSSLCKSCMTSFHASPVDARNSVMNALAKCLKLPCSLWVSDSWLTVENKLTPKMLNNTKKRKATTPTLANFTTEIAKAANNFLRLRSALNLNKRNNRAMRKIRTTEATEDTLIPVLNNFSDTPAKVATMQKKSKRFQASFQ